MKRRYLFTTGLLALVCSLYGCGHVSNTVLTDEILLDKAEMATVVRQSELTLIKREGSIDSVEYSVETKDGDVYRCYFTSLVAINSDAVCKKINTSKKFKGTKSSIKQNSKKENQKCNALLKAAGKC